LFLGMGVGLCLPLPLLVCLLRVALLLCLPVVWLCPPLAGIARRLLPSQPVIWASPVWCALCLGMGVGLC
jgi:hypothetical protein